MSVSEILRWWPRTKDIGNKFLDEETRGLACTYAEITRMRNAEFPRYAADLEQKVERWTGEIWDEYERFTWGRGAR